MALLQRAPIVDSCAERQVASCGHRITSIDADVQQSLIDLIRIGQHRRNRMIEPQLYADRFWKGLVDKCAYPDNDLVKIRVCQAGVCLARERQKLPYDRRAAVDFFI